jgi:hypothetical protein
MVGMLAAITDKVPPPLWDHQGMFALAAVITFILAFILALLGQDTGNVNLLYLGLAFISLHLLTGYAVPWGRRP